MFAQIIDLPEEEDEKETGSGITDLGTASSKAVVVKTSTRSVRAAPFVWRMLCVTEDAVVHVVVQNVILPMSGLVRPSELKPNDLVGVNKDTHLIMEKLPTEYVLGCVVSVLWQCGALAIAY